MSTTEILDGCYDLHVHCGPDVVPRAQDLVELAVQAELAGMAGIGLKDHTTSTVGRCYALNSLRPNGPKFYSSLVLNPPVGGLNPAAVEATLATGADIIYFPTYSSRCHIETLGSGTTPVPHPRSGPQIIDVLVDGELRREVREIVGLIKEYDAVMATGHLSAQESLALIDYAVRVGVQSIVVTHASESVPNMSIDDQRKAVSQGAIIEHSMLAATPCCPGTIAMSTIAEQIRAVGVDNVILTSDFGQVDNGPPVQAFARHVDALARLGFADDEMRKMLCRNPGRLLEHRPSNLVRE